MVAWARLQAGSSAPNASSYIAADNDALRSLSGPSQRDFCILENFAERCSSRAAELEKKMEHLANRYGGAASPSATIQLGRQAKYEEWWGIMTEPAQSQIANCQLHLLVMSCVRLSSRLPTAYHLGRATPAIVRLSSRCTPAPRCMPGT